jgi:adenylate cyclase class 2
MAVEIEKKYRLTEDQRQALVDSLTAAGAEYMGEDLEENTIYGGGVLDEQPSILRIRRTDDKNILTYKRRIESTSDAKQQIEHESEFADAESIASILADLGFVKRLVYEKRRKTWKFRSVEVVVDELPFGLFMEIEGPVTAIIEAEELLDMLELEVVHETYPQLTLHFGKNTAGVIEARF